MNKWLELIVGMIFISLAVYLWVSSTQFGEFWNFGKAAWILIKGSFLLSVVFIGFILVILGISDLKN